MKKESLFITILIISLILGSSLFVQGAEDIKRLKSQIHILNLLNGLELDKEQMQLILDAAKQAEDIRHSAKEKLAQKEGEITNVYNEVLKVTKSGTWVIPQDVSLRVHKINQEIGKIKEEAQEELTNLIVKIKDNLKPHQIYILDDYKLCIIPQIKQGRIGQADDHKGFVKILERVYKMPQNLYNIKKEEICQRLTDKLKAKTPLGFIFDQEELKTKILKAMDEVRQMSEIDFNLKKEEIAKEIEVQLLPQRPAPNMGIKTERLLLSSEIIPILEERIASE